MFFLDFHILILQILPPSWRFYYSDGNPPVISGKVLFLRAVLAPFKHLLNELNLFRSQSKTKINLTAQTIVIVNHVRSITGLLYGVYIVDLQQANQFELNLPISAQNKEYEIRQFLNKVLPAGRLYTLNFY